MCTIRIDFNNGYNFKKVFQEYVLVPDLVTIKNYEIQVFGCLSQVHSRI